MWHYKHWLDLRGRAVLRSGCSDRRLIIYKNGPGVVRRTTVRVIRISMISKVRIGLINVRVIVSFYKMHFRQGR